MNIRYGVVASRPAALPGRGCLRRPGQDLHPRHRAPGSAHVRHRSPEGAPAGEQQYAERDRQPIRDRAGPARRQAARRSGQRRDQRGPEDRVHRQPPRSGRQRRVPPARRPRRDRGDEREEDDRPEERRHRGGAGAAHRHGAFRRGGPGAAPGHVHRGQRGEPSHRGRRQPDHLRGSQDRQPPRRGGAGARERHASVHLPGFPNPVRVAERATFPGSLALAESGLGMLPGHERDRDRAHEQGEDVLVRREWRNGRPGAGAGGQEDGVRGPPHPDADWTVGDRRQSQWALRRGGEPRKPARRVEGNTISIIDVDRIEAALADPTVKAEVARVRVGTNDPAGQTRPFIPSFTPNGKEIVVPNFRANNVSIVDLEKALAGDPGAEFARIPLTRPADADDVVRPSRPKGSAVTSDGRYAVISGGGRTTFVPSGTVWVIDLRTRGVVGTVTGVGNDPYGPGRARRRLRRQRPRSSASTIATSQLPGGSSWASSHASASGTYAGAYAVAVTTTVQARLGPGPRPPSSNKPSWSVLAVRSCWPGHLSATPAPRTAPASAPRTCPCTLQAGSHAAAAHNASGAKRRPIDPSTCEMPRRALPLPRPGWFRLSCGTVPRLPLPPCAGAGRDRPFRGRLSWRVFWKARSRSSPERAAASAASTRSPSRARGRRSWSTTWAPTATAGARARWPTRPSRTSRRPAAKPARTMTASPRARARTASCGPRSTSTGASTCWS